jgi:hypothetical protein
VVPPSPLVPASSPLLAAVSLLAPVIEAETEAPCVTESPELSPHAASRTSRTGERGARGLRMSAEHNRAAGRRAKPRA